MSEINYRNKLIVKSNNLIESKYHLSVREQKFIIFLASLIDRDTTDLNQTKVKIKEIEAALKGSDDKKWGSIYEVVREVVLSINTKPLSIKKDNGGWMIINWFSMVDADTEQGIITFELSESIKRQLLKLNEYFTRYRFGNILSLKSGYSIRIYELLKLNQFKGKARYELSHFRELVGVSYLDENRQMVHKYEQYKIFKNRVIKHAQKELKKRTDIYFELKEEREGRSVKYLTFYMFKNDNNTPKADLFTDNKTKVEKDESFPYNPEVITAFVKLGLTETKAEQLYRAGFNTIENDDIRKQIVKEGRSLTEYFLEKVEYTNFMIDKGEVQNPAGLLLSAIKENYTSKEKVKQKKEATRLKNRLKADRAKLNKEAELHQLKKALNKKEKEIALQIINDDKTLLDQLWSTHQTAFKVGFNKELSLKENFENSPIVRSRIINILKEINADQFAHLATEGQQIDQFAQQVFQM